MRHSVCASGRYRPAVLRACLTAALSFVVLAALSVPNVLAKEKEVECSRSVNEVKPAPPLKSAVTLTPNAQSAQRQVNFGPDRDTKYVRNIRLSAEPPLPKRITPEQIGFEALISRTGDTLESTDFSEPTFTSPRILEEGKAVVFTICLDPDDGIEAGKYVGTINVGGPPGLGPAAVNLTVTAKNGCLFWVGGIAALLLCLVLLLFKDAISHFKKPGDNWLEALKQPVTDMRWWPATLIALGAAFGTLYAAYANDPSWGANGFGAIVTLIGTAIAAIGGKSVLSAFAKPSEGDAKP